MCQEELSLESLDSWGPVPLLLLSGQGVSVFHVGNFYGKSQVPSSSPLMLSWERCGKLLVGLSRLS